MPPHRFETLGERLLRAGVAPRHVARYVRELEEHYQDAVRSELARGASPEQARLAARERLGTEDSLVQGMLERRELRSRAARFPALFFGVSPALAWIGVPIAVHLAVSWLPDASHRTQVNAAFIEAYYTLTLVYTRVLPALLGAVVLELAARRRLRPLWPLAGAAAVDLLAGTVTVYSFPGQLGVTSSLLPWLLPFADFLGPKDAVALGQGVLRAAALLAFSVLLQRLLRRLRVFDRLQPSAE